MMINKYKYYLLGGLIILSFSLGWKFSSWQCSSEKLEAVKRAIEQAEQLQREIDDIEESYINSNEKIKIKYKYIDREVVKYVKNTNDVQCLNSVGVQLWNLANKAEHTTTTSN